MGKDLRNKELGIGISQRKDGVYVARFTNRTGKRIFLSDSDLSLLRRKFEKAKVECIKLEPKVNKIEIVFK